MDPMSAPEADRLREALRLFAEPENWESITVRDEGEEHEVWAWNNYRTPYEFAAAALRDRAGVPPPQDRAELGVVAAESEGIRECVEAYTKVGVTALIVEKGRVLLGVKGRAFDAAFTKKWVTPGGRVGYGESLIEALVREVREETGLGVRVMRPLGPQELIHPKGHYVFFAWEVEPADGSVCAGDDLTAVQWFTPDEARTALDDMTEVTRAIVEDWLRAAGARSAPVPLARAPLDRAALGGVPAESEAATLREALRLAATFHHDGSPDAQAECVRALMGLWRSGVRGRREQSEPIPSAASRSSGPTDPDRAGSGVVAAESEGDVATERCSDQDIQRLKAVVDQTRAVEVRVLLERVTELEAALAERPVPLARAPLDRMEKCAEEFRSRAIAVAACPGDRRLLSRFDQELESLREALDHLAASPASRSSGPTDPDRA